MSLESLYLREHHVFSEQPDGHDDKQTVKNKRKAYYYVNITASIHEAYLPKNDKDAVATLTLTMIFFGRQT